MKYERSANTKADSLFKRKYQNICKPVWLLAAQLIERKQYCETRRKRLMVSVFLRRLITGRLHPHQRTKGWPWVNVKGPTITGKKYFLPIFFLPFLLSVLTRMRVNSARKNNNGGFRNISSSPKQKFFRSNAGCQNRGCTWSAPDLSWKKIKKAAKS